MLLATISTLHAAPAIAQPGPTRSRVEIGVGLLGIGSIPLGARAASETTASGGTSVLFSTTSELGGAAGLEGRIGVRVTESIGLEGQVSYVKPELRIAVSADAEGAAAVTAVEAIQQFTIGGRALFYFRAGAGRRALLRLRWLAVATCGNCTSRRRWRRPDVSINSAAASARCWCRVGTFTPGAPAYGSTSARSCVPGASRSTAVRRRRPLPVPRPSCVSSRAVCYRRHSDARAGD